MTLHRVLTGLRPGQGVGVAVSGGGDSMALLDMVIQAAEGRPVEAATVDHGLRPEAPDEAAMVARFCAARGVRHQTLQWLGWDQTGNLQAEARAARYRLLADWARDRRLAAVLLAHSRDDVAETFLIRLGRASGLDGLSRMRQDFQRDGVTFIRPLLDMGREELRDHLRARGIAWVEDPSNTDDHYARVRMRKALELLRPLGLDPAMIARSAAALADAREVLDASLAEVAARDLRLDHGDFILNFSRPGNELQRRLLVAALQRMAGADWPVRHQAMAATLDALERQGRATLGGCLLTLGHGQIRMSREFQAVKAVETPFGQLWDGRWQLTGPGETHFRIRALGEGLRLCPDWRERGLPRTSQLAGPSVWDGDRLLAAPLAGYGENWRAELVKGFGSFPELH